MPALWLFIPVLKRIEEGSCSLIVLRIDLYLLLQQKLHIIFIISMLVFFLHVAMQQGATIRIPVFDIQAILLKKMEAHLIGPFAY